jgi:Uma2 family endonuclease
MEPSPDTALKLVADDYWHLPEDGKRYELLDGGLNVIATPNRRHQRVSHLLEGYLTSGLEKRGLGEVYSAPLAVILDDHSVVEPDLLYVSKERSHILADRGIEGAPDLVIEILSPSSRRTDAHTKSKLYARTGVRHYWIADPELDRLELYRLAGSEYEHVATFETPAVVEPEDFPGLRIPLDDVFRR